MFDVQEEGKGKETANERRIFHFRPLGPLGRLGPLLLMICFSLTAGENRPSKPRPLSWDPPADVYVPATREDNADHLQGAERVAAYRALLAEKIPDQRIRQRITRKLAWSQNALRLERMSRDQREALALEAAEIGESYVRNDDIHRARNWMNLIDRVQPQSPETAYLMNRIRQYLRGKLNAAMTADDTEAARDWLRRWKFWYPHDFSLERAGAAYARWRAGQLQQALAQRNPEAVLTDSAREESWLPDPVAWTSLRNGVLASIDNAINRALRERDLPGMRKALDQRTTLFPQTGGMEAFEDEFQNLSAALQPHRLKKDYGRLHEADWRLEFNLLVDRTWFHLPGVNAKDAVTGFWGSVEYRGGEFPMMTRARWGLSLDVALRTATDRNVELSLQDVLLSVRIGWMGERWLAGIGMGPGLLSYEADLSGTKEDSRVPAAVLEGFAEFGLTQAWSLFGRIRGGWSTLSTPLAAVAGIRFYTSPNVALHVAGMWHSHRVDDRINNFRFRSEHAGGTAGILFQF